MRKESQCIAQRKFTYPQLIFIITQIPITAKAILCYSARKIFFLRDAALKKPSSGVS